MTKARTLADFISDGNPLADGTIAVSEVSGAAPLASPSFTGNIAVTGNVDGRDVAADGTKLDGIETSATADQTDAEIRTAVEAATDSNVFTDADHTKLNAIEASADVTDTVNVVAALTAGSNITIASDGTIAGAAQYTHPTHAGDDAAIDTGALSGATVISDLDLNITTDTLGHVTDANATVATRNLTLANLGYTGATDATNDTTANAALPKAGGAVTGNVTFGDSNKLVMGSGSDLQLYHDGSHSYIDDAGTGQLLIRGREAIVLEDITSGDNYIYMERNNKVELSYSGSPKLATTTSGIDVTGTVNADALTGIGSIDATTAAAFGAAGVGGLTTLIAEDASMGSGAQLKLSLGDYDEQTFIISNLKKDSTTPDEVRAGLGLSNTSGNLNTGQDYVGIVSRRNTGENQWSGLGTGTAYYNNYALNITNGRFPTNSTGAGVLSTGRVDGMVKVRNAKSTTKPTELFARFHFMYPNNLGDCSYTSLTYNLKNNQANNHIVFYFQTSGSTYASGGTYTSWGVN